MTNILGVDIGGTNVKIRVSDRDEIRKIPSGPDRTPERMVAEVLQHSSDWAYERVSIGYPGVVGGDRPMHEPMNLGAGWVGFDFGRAFGPPVRIVNDAAMQALGSYEGGKMLFLGLGTGLGSAMVVDGTLVPMELGHLPYRKRTFEDYVGRRGLERRHKKKWRKSVTDVVNQLFAALQPDYVVLGGGNAKKLAKLPPHTRLGYIQLNLLDLSDARFFSIWTPNWTPPARTASPLWR